MKTIIYLRWRTATQTITTSHAYSSVLQEAMNLDFQTWRASILEAGNRRGDVYLGPGAKNDPAPTVYGSFAVQGCTIDVYRHERTNRLRINVSDSDGATDQPTLDPQFNLTWNHPERYAKAVRNLCERLARKLWMQDERRVS